MESRVIGGSERLESYQKFIAGCECVNKKL